MEPYDFSNVMEEIDGVERAAEDACRGLHAEDDPAVDPSLALAQVRAQLVAARATEHVAERLDKLIELLFDEGKHVYVRTLS